MEENGYRFGVGVLVLASAMIGVLLVAFFGAVPTLWVDRYRITYNFPRAPKVTVDTPVRKNGVLIGRVSKVDLLKGDDGVNLTMELDRKYELRKSEVPRIASGSFITGDAVVEFMVPSDESRLARFDGSMGTPSDGQLDEQERRAADEIITEGFYSRGGEVAKDPTEFLTKLESNFEEKVAPLVEAMERTFKLVADGGEPIKDFVNSAKLTLDNANNAINTFNDIGIQVRNAELPQLLANSIVVLPDLFREAQAALTQTQRTLRGFEQFSASLEGLGKEFEGIGQTIRSAVDNANVAIENIAEITEPVSQNSERLVAGAVHAMEDLDALAKDLKKFTAKLNSSDGTISKLIENPQLYYKVLQTVGDIQAASRNIQSITHRIQPIVGDVRVLTDKISRDPGRLIRDGFRFQRPSGLGYK